MSLRMTLSAVNLDCPDPTALAAFYQRATGLEPDPKSTAEFAGLRRSDGFYIGFQRVAGHRPPTWPDPDVPQQLHLCFDVVGADLDEAEARLLELGAGRPDHQPNEDRWRVLTDPAGHPFCIIARG
ncbi:VOC family protein [Streptomyces sp. NPDC014894]|uniref:VOC family protein n=1 Tax=unclassified Streptomyces TaxID=2593676 RepID=UPI003701A672